MGGDLGAGRTDRRDGIIHAALAAGQLSPAEAGMPATPGAAPTGWRAQLDRDEAGVVGLLSGLPANRVPVTPVGSAAAAALGQGGDSLDAAWDGLERAMFGADLDFARPAAPPAS